MYTPQEREASSSEEEIGVHSAPPPKQTIDHSKVTQYATEDINNLTEAQIEKRIKYLNKVNKKES